MIPAILILVGAAVVIATTVKTHHLIRLLNSQGAWSSVRNLTMTFAVIYAVYALLLILQRPFDRDLIVGIVFLLSAVFMYVVVRFALGTIRDIMRLDEFEQLVNTDDLTGLFNRRAIAFLLNQEFRKAKQFGFPLSLAMVEVNQYDTVLKEHGREAADRVLKKVGEVLRHRLRQIDLIGRFDDHRFLCVLPSTADEGAGMAGARMRTAIRAVRFVVDDSEQLVPDPRPDQFREGLELSSSIGMATLTVDVESAHELLEATSDALRTSLTRGGNRVTIADRSAEEEDPESGSSDDVETGAADDIDQGSTGVSPREG